jgi:hypothetical protein
MAIKKMMNETDVIKAIEKYFSDGMYCPYKIGDIYLTLSNDDPSSIWVGTAWERVAGGRVLVGTDPAPFGITNDHIGIPEAIGGSHSFIMTQAQMPSHKHNLNTLIATRLIVSAETVAVGGLGDVNRWFRVTSLVAPEDIIGLDLAGGNQPISVIQPYMTCHIYKRIS